MDEWMTKSASVKNHQKLNRLGDWWLTCDGGAQCICSWALWEHIELGGVTIMTGAPRKAPWPSSDCTKSQCRVLYKLRLLSLQGTEEDLSSSSLELLWHTGAGGHGQRQPLHLCQHPWRQPSPKGGRSWWTNTGSRPWLLWASWKQFCMHLRRPWRIILPLWFYIHCFSSLCHSACSFILASWDHLSCKLSCLRLCF